MPATNAVSGHPIQLAIAAAGPTPAFLVIGELRGNITQGQETREVKEVTFHGQALDEYVVSPVKKRAVINFQFNNDDTNVGQDGVAGLRFFMDNGQLAVLQFRGPLFDVGVLHDKEIDGFVVSLEESGDQGANEYTGACGFQPSGAYIINDFLHEADGTITDQSP